jgi:hypothetical protein
MEQGRRAVYLSRASCRSADALSRNLTQLRILVGRRHSRRSRVAHHEYRGGLQLQSGMPAERLGLTAVTAAVD